MFNYSVSECTLIAIQQAEQENVQILEHILFEYDLECFHHITIMLSNINIIILLQPTTSKQVWQDLNKSKWKTDNKQGNRVMEMYAHSNQIHKFRTDFTRYSFRSILLNIKRSYTLRCTIVNFLPGNYRLHV